MTPKGRSSKRSTNIFSIVSMMAFMAVWLSACIVNLTPAATAYPTCAPNYSANIYNPTQTPSVFPTVPPLPAPASTQPVQASLTREQLAFRELVDHVERWTNMITIPIGETSSARVAITLLSPELVWTVSFIDKMDENPNNPYIYSEASEHLGEIAASNSFLFFMAIFPIGSGEAGGIPHTIQINAGQLSLVSAKGIAIKPVSYDHNLDYRFPSTETTYGYLYFPISVNDGSGCIDVLDSTFDTKIIFQLPEVRIDDAPTGPYSWMIQYTYLLNSENIHHNRDGLVPPVDADIRAKDLPPNSVDINEDFWRDYAEFIWGKTTP